MARGQSCTHRASRCSHENQLVTKDLSLSAHAFVDYRTTCCSAPKNNAFMARITSRIIRIMSSTNAVATAPARYGCLVASHVSPMARTSSRSEEHTSELQSHVNLV